MTNSIARRYFLQQCGYGLGRAALASLIGGVAANTSSRGMASEPNRMAGLTGVPHFAPRAKRIIHLFMAGAPSHLELFDYKPKLFELAGKPLPPEVIRGQRYAFIRPDSAVLEPQFAFQPATDAGMQISDALPHLRKIANQLCFVRSMHTDQFNHAPAQIFLNSGFAQPGRPSLGSWLVYGLGCETQELPAFVVMSTGAGISGGAANWSSGFLPTRYAGTRLRSGNEPILNVNNPEGISQEVQQDSIAAIEGLNRKRLAKVGDPEINSRIAAYELAFRLQTTAPELMRLADETQETLDLYGCDPAKPSFARGCLLARRMIERGVRMVTLYNEGWDAHSDVKGNHTNNCKATDQACAALIQDLDRRGLLEDTLVVWGGEFGRTPMVESNPTLGRKLGRDHHPQAFTVWMAGGGAKSGVAWGQTDELGFHVVDQPVHIHDLQATILHLMGIDHERLTYFHQGREFRLTDVHGRVVQELIA